MNLRARTIALPGAVLAILIGAAPAALAATDAAAPTAQAPAADTRVAPPPAGKGQIVFFRPWAYAGAAVGFSVHEGTAGVGKLGNNSYFILTADPGDHTFTIQSEATDTLHMEVDAGETYYVKETLGMGMLLYRPHLTPSDEATFEKLKGPRLSTQKATDLAPPAPAH